VSVHGRKHCVAGRVWLLPWALRAAGRCPNVLDRRGILLPMSRGGVIPCLDGAAMNQDRPCFARTFAARRTPNKLVQCHAVNRADVLDPTPRTGCHRLAAAPVTISGSARARVIGRRGRGQCQLEPSSSFAIAQRRGIEAESIFDMPPPGVRCIILVVIQDHEHPFAHSACHCSAPHRPCPQEIEPSPTRQSAITRGLAAYRARHGKSRARQK